MSLNKKPTPEQIEDFIKITEFRDMRNILGFPIKGKITEKEEKFFKRPNNIDLTMKFLDLCFKYNDTLSFKKINQTLQLYKNKTLYEIEVENKINSELSNMTEMFNRENGINFNTFLENMKGEKINNGNMEITENKISIKIDGITIELLKKFENINSNSNFNDKEFNINTLKEIYKEIQKIKNKIQSQNVSEAMAGNTKNRNREEKTNSPSLNYNLQL